MKWIKLILSIIITGSLLFILNTKLGQLPPLGKLFNPFTGFWQNAEEIDKTFLLETTNENLTSEIKVVFDDNLVPHIFAENDHDLYFAQGYVTAMLRLWQMEFQTHYAAGRLSEVVGEVALPLDLFQRKIGMTWSAEKTLEFIQQNPETNNIVQSFSDGVNHYINELKSKDYPLEYKILDYEPEAWTPLKSALLLNYMAWDLTGYNTDLRMTNVLKKYGMATVESLFNDPDTFMDPIIPPGTLPDYEPLKSPERPQQAYYIPGDNKMAFDLNEPDPDNGSNNWAISGSKSATGLPILANDPHLKLSLPSVWLQMQLISPDMNVYGATLPGAPAVIIGFNKDIAWGETNVDADVLDWYHINFRDTSMREYYHEGRWKSTVKRKEEIKIRGQESRMIDVVHTHHGPVVFNPDEDVIKGRKALPKGYAMKWLAHEPNNPIQTFYMLNKAKNYDQYVEALSHYYCPAQNFVYADAENNIAIWANGRYPLKWEGQGQFLLDGSDQRHDWSGWIPHNQNPHVKNPERGFVSSANQDVTDTLYPYYLNWEFTTFERGARINDQLSVLSQAKAKDLQNIQNDNYNLQASYAVPKFIELLSQSEQKMTDSEKRAFSLLKTWDYKNDAEALGASIYTRFWDKFDTAIWSDDFPSKENMLMPDNTRTLMLLLDSAEWPWIDDKGTASKENKTEIVLQAWKTAINSLENNFGEDSKTWQWGTVKNTRIGHLGRIPGFGSENIWNGGGHNIVNATQGTKGPSWRMIVELDKELPRGYGVFPGGQSGNPGSPYYDNMVEIWASGELQELNYLERESVDNMAGMLILKKD